MPKTNIYIYLSSKRSKNIVTAYCRTRGRARSGYRFTPASRICIPNTISAIDALPFCRLCKIIKKLPSYIYTTNILHNYVYTSKVSNYHSHITLKHFIPYLICINGVYNISI